MFRQVTRMCILLDIILLFGLNILQQNTKKICKICRCGSTSTSSTKLLAHQYTPCLEDSNLITFMFHHTSSVSSKLSIGNLEFLLLTFNFRSFWALCALGRREVTFARFLYYYRQLLGDNSFFGCVPCPWVGILSNLHT